MPTLRTLQKNGKSVMVTIPAEIRDAMDLMFGDTIAFSLVSDETCAFWKVDLQKHPEYRDFNLGGIAEIKYGK